MSLKKISSLTTETLPDECPDLSYLGEYANSPAEHFSIDREERGYRGRSEYRYFTAANVEDDKQAEENYQRAEAYNRGVWSMVGIRAVAEIEVSHDDGKSWTIHTLHSPGLWGIESDSDAAYLREVGVEQMEDLFADLRSLGFSEEEIAAARA